MKNGNHKRPGWNTANPEFYKRYNKARKDLFLQMTTSEKKLWNRLRRNQLGVRFRRQHVIESFIPDFVCLPLKLIIEVDGKIHLKQKDKDVERTQYLKMMGYNVIRFTNEEVENNIEKVIQSINKYIEKRNS